MYVYACIQNLRVLLGCGNTVIVASHSHMGVEGIKRTAKKKNPRECNKICFSHCK